MGSAMAARLISDGAAVTVLDRTTSRTAPLIELGATQADAVSDLGHCDIVFTSVMSSPDFLAATLGPEGLLRAQTSPSIVVNCSTVSAEAAAEVRAEATSRGIGFFATLYEVAARAAALPREDTH
jgi:3-hydroxyisobutyrate dehydrogenase-like beta-hydroxyacid dehydrogenase